MRTNGKNSASHQSASSSAMRVSSLPPLKALLAFEAAARQGSFTRGAEELGVTPSAVSHHIQQLEDFLGVPLFERHAGRASLTRAGSSYAQEIEHAFGLIAGATDLVRPQRQSDSLIVASSPSFASKWLQPRLCDFLTSNPLLKIRLTTFANIKDLDSSRFDIAICYGSPLASNARAEPLLSEKLLPLCSPKLAASLNLSVPVDLMGATLIHSANSLTWSEYFRRVGCGEVKPKHELWFDRSTMAIDAAMHGLGVVLESEILAGQELREGSLIAPFPQPAFQVELTTYFLARPAGSRNRIVHFEKWLRAALGSSNLSKSS